MLRLSWRRRPHAVHPRPPPSRHATSDASGGGTTKGGAGQQQREGPPAPLRWGLPLVQVLRLLPSRVAELPPVTVLGLLDRPIWRLRPADRSLRAFCDGILSPRDMHILNLVMNTTMSLGDGSAANANAAPHDDAEAATAPAARAPVATEEAHPDPTPAAPTATARQPSARSRRRPLSPPPSAASTSGDEPAAEDASSSPSPPDGPTAHPSRQAAMLNNAGKKAYLPWDAPERDNYAISFGADPPTPLVHTFLHTVSEVFMELFRAGIPGVSAGAPSPLSAPGLADPKGPFRQLVAPRLASLLDLCAELSAAAHTHPQALGGGSPLQPQPWGLLPPASIKRVLHARIVDVHSVWDGGPPPSSPAHSAPAGAGGQPQAVQQPQERQEAVAKWSRELRLAAQAWLRKHRLFRFKSKGDEEGGSSSSGGGVGGVDPGEADGALGDRGGDSGAGAHAWARETGHSVSIQPTKGPLGLLGPLLNALLHFHQLLPPRAIATRVVVALVCEEEEGGQVATAVGDRTPGALHLPLSLEEAPAPSTGFPPATATVHTLTLEALLEEVNPPPFEVMRFFLAPSLRVAKGWAVVDIDGSLASLCLAAGGGSLREDELRRAVREAVAAAGAPQPPGSGTPSDESTTWGSGEGATHSRAPLSPPPTSGSPWNTFGSVIDLLPDSLPLLARGNRLASAQMRVEVAESAAPVLEYAQLNAAAAAHAGAAAVVLQGLIEDLEAGGRYPEAGGTPSMGTAPPSDTPPPPPSASLSSRAAAVAAFDDAVASARSAAALAGERAEAFAALTGVSGAAVAATAAAGGADRAAAREEADRALGATLAAGARAREALQVAQEAGEAAEAAEAAAAAATAELPPASAAAAAGDVGPAPAADAPLPGSPPIPPPSSSSSPPHGNGDAALPRGPVTPLQLRHLRASLAVVSRVHACTSNTAEPESNPPWERRAAAEADWERGALETLRRGIAPPPDAPPPAPGAPLPPAPDAPSRLAALRRAVASIPPPPAFDPVADSVAMMRELRELFSVRAAVRRAEAEEEAAGGEEGAPAAGTLGGDATGGAGTPDQGADGRSGSRGQGRRSVGSRRGRAAKEQEPPPLPRTPASPSPTGEEAEGESVGYYFMRLHLLSRHLILRSAGELACATLDNKACLSRVQAFSEAASAVMAALTSLAQADTSPGHVFAARAEGLAAGAEGLFGVPEGLGSLRARGPMWPDPPKQRRKPRGGLGGGAEGGATAPGSASSHDGDPEQRGSDDDDDEEEEGEEDADGDAALLTRLHRAAGALPAYSAALHALIRDMRNAGMRV